ncbi:MAG: hypothetical protein K2Y19_09345 [Afipia birgiae]|jgi:hypothetical protein|nr:hypothetical protein [Afipia birgiae]
MSDYKLTQTDSVIRTADGASIPNDPANRDRAEYDVWIADGGVPDPYVPPLVKHQIRKSTIIARLTDEQLAAAIGGMTVRQQERWRAPDQPLLNTDDPEAIAIIEAVGADPAVILAPEA